MSEDMRHKMNEPKDDGREVKEVFVISSRGGGVSSDAFDHYPTKAEIKTFMMQFNGGKGFYVRVEKLYELED